MSKLQTGTIKFFLYDGRKWGFIKPKGGGRDVFIHINDYSGKQPPQRVNDGTQIFYYLEDGRSSHRPKAKNWVLAD